MSQLNASPNISGQPLPQAGKAIAALVLGIVSIPTCVLYGLPAMICGILAIVFYKQTMTQIRNGERNANSAGLAKAGMICGCVGIGLGVLCLLIMIIFIIVAAANA